MTLAGLRSTEVQDKTDMLLACLMTGLTQQTYHTSSEPFTQLYAFLVTGIL